MRIFGKRNKPGRRKPTGEVTALGWRARDDATGPGPDDRGIGDLDHPVIDGPHYIDVLKGLHIRHDPNWYFEIGSFTGKSLDVVSCDFVSVDPEFRLRKPYANAHRRAHFMQMTSDEFFEEGFLVKNAIKPDLSFLDGMHLFEYLLRDFINTERLSPRDGTIVLHDCTPSNPLMEARTWDAKQTDYWTGDVWKTLLILLEERPDLRIAVLDAWPTGLAVIHNLDPNNTVLSDAYDELVDKYKSLTLNEFGIENFFSRFPILSSFRYLNRKS